MLRRQQAAAVVAARETLVAGMVEMVEMALAMISEKKSSSLMTSAERQWFPT